MTLVAHLLGPPMVTRDDVVYAAPRGKKVWSLFAYLALAERPPTRQQLAELLFPDAEDPGERAAVEPVRVAPAPGRPGHGGQRQHGGICGCPPAPCWTSGSCWTAPPLRRSNSRGWGGSSWRTSRSRRARGSMPGCWASGGDSMPWPARCCAKVPCAGSPRATLGTRSNSRPASSPPIPSTRTRMSCWCARSPPPETRSPSSVSSKPRRTCSGASSAASSGRSCTKPRAWTRLPARPAGPPARRRSQALVESGNAAVLAGAVDAGLHDLRAAANEARDVGDATQEAAAWFALGSALVHAAKGRDEEGSAALHRVIAISEESGDRRLAAACHRELGYVELLRADYPRAQVWLRTASELADERRRVGDLADPIGDRDRAQRCGAARPGRARVPGRDRAGAAGRPRTADRVVVDVLRTCAGPP